MTAKFFIESVATAKEKPGKVKKNKRKALGVKKRIKDCQGFDVVVLQWKK
jgi:hypothetical protein